MHLNEITINKTENLVKYATEYYLFIFSSLN